MLIALVPLHPRGVEYRSGLPSRVLPKANPDVVMMMMLEVPRTIEPQGLRYGSPKHVTSLGRGGPGRVSGRNIKRVNPRQVYHASVIRYRRPKITSRTDFPMLISNLRQHLPG